MAIPTHLLMGLLCSTITLNYLGVPYNARITPGGRDNCKVCCPIKREDVIFHIYVKKNYEEVYRTYTGLTDAQLLNNGKTNIIYIHGFSEGNMKGASPPFIKDVFLTRNLENVIIVDWANLAAIPWYPHAIQNTKYVAELVAKFIDDLVCAGIPLYKFHLVGFSLGAETSGLVGNMIKSGKLSRITGLDPAFPLYAGVSNLRRLSTDDADFVDVIHTDGGIFGFPTPVGHADFFPNGGTPFQPGCSLSDVDRMGNFHEFIACSHLRAWRYFGESVLRPFDFPAAPCPSAASFNAGECPINPYQGIYMGYLVNRTLRGTFYLKTRPVYPFGQGA